ncbi:MAG: DUF1499 domain-containing protein [Acidobacteriota bacterium]|jgi:uncharacterized protein (DUF1499 family)
MSSDRLRNAPSLRPCPHRPNCVSSLASREDQYVAPFDNAEPSDMDTLKTVLEEMDRCSVVEAGPTYLRAECKSRFLGLIDDLELLLDVESKVIHVRSASRIGYSDLGVNRRRVEALKSRFRQRRKATRLPAGG